MGAACTIDDFRQSVTPYMLAQQNSETNFYNFMLHPIAENSEAHGLGIGGTGSLLTQIDDLYENPVLESGRVLGRWTNTMNGLNYFDNRIRNRVWLRAMPFDARYPTKHGSFDESEYTDSGLFWRGTLGARPVDSE